MVLEDHNDRHRKRQQNLKSRVDARISSAKQQRGVFIIFTGNGKGKTTAAIGTVSRALGHGKKVGIAQYIKKKENNGEFNFLSQFNVEFHTMETDFTWETQNAQVDTEAARKVWQESKRMLADESYDLVILDEITYMLTYHYLDTQEVMNAIQSRPQQQSVIVTGRGCHRNLLSIADTVSEIRSVKHAFDTGVKAQEGIDW
ncbi:TPA: cob(I)yrinic acid a,c-diamide adenosyltransferase [Escherichia coli]|nr:cob(I)yrinic acid a,c-diamide adenosyltransferase [Escherichia coli]HCX4437333.1 cob(I)yrinic acid a,c-diamide adenosyltransferase [Escherichia coli]